MCILGNILVIISVFTYRPLQNVQNMFIVSLAVADLLVCILCVPFHIITEIANGIWLFGPIICHFFITLDVLLCTASILNLCCIALDRYWAIKDSIKYAQKRTFKRVLFMILISWLISAFVSVPGILWNTKDLNDKNYTEFLLINKSINSLEEVQSCDISKDKSYRFFSSMCTFYIPLVIMSFVYLRIYLETKKRLGERAKAAKKLANSIANSSCSSNILKKNSKISNRYLLFYSFLNCKTKKGNIKKNILNNNDNNKSLEISLKNNSNNNRKNNTSFTSSIHKANENRFDSTETEVAQSYMTEIKEPKIKFALSNKTDKNSNSK